MANWEELERRCLSCQKCALADTRTNVVFGKGPRDAKILFIGEGPGENEDLQGEPFVGRGGQLLDEMLGLVGLSREKNFYITNIVKCRPPKNRDPLNTEQDACIGYLWDQMALIRPRIVVCLGRIAAMRLIDGDFRITRDHGKWYDVDGMRMMAVYHPSALLRDVTNNQIYEGAFSGIVRAFREVYYLQLQENYCRMLYPDGDLILERGNYEGMVDRHFGTGRIVRDREEEVRRFLSLNHLREALETQDTVEFRYRRSTRYSPDEWCVTTFTVSERENGKPKTAVVTIRSIDKLVKEEQERRQEHMVETLANMSDAFFVYSAREGEKLLYANPAVIDLFGCKTLTELMEYVGGSFRGIVHPEDLDRVEWEISHQIQHSDRNMDYVQYRIIRKDGEIRWVDDWGNLETSKYGEENRLFYVFLKDITGEITTVQQEKLLNSNRFYAPECRNADEEQ